MCVYVRVWVWVCLWSPPIHLDISTINAMAASLAGPFDDMNEHKLEEEIQRRKEPNKNMNEEKCTICSVQHSSE